MKTSEIGKVIKERQLKSGTAFICELTDSLWVIGALDSEENLIFTRGFIYTESTKKLVWKHCKDSYKIVADCLMKHQQDLLIEEALEL